MIRRFLVAAVLLAVLFNSIFPVRVYDADTIHIGHRAGRALILASDFGVANFLTGNELDRIRKLNPGNKTLGRSDENGYAVWDNVYVDWEFFICTNLALLSIAGIICGLRDFRLSRRSGANTKSHSSPDHIESK